MTPLTDCVEPRSPIERLQDLLPGDLRSQVVIVLSANAKPPLISTRKTRKHQFVVEIDGIKWQTLTVDQQNLLFWHEVAHMQTHAIAHLSLEKTVILMGLGFALLEVVAHNVISLVAALLAVALASHQLYQRSRGEQSLRKAVAADRCAIQLAIASGYSFSTATASLRSAINRLAQSAQPPNRNKSQVRQRALEMLVAETERQSQLASDPLTVAWEGR